MDKNRIIAAAGFLVFAIASLALISLAGITPEFMDSIVLKTIKMTFSQQVPVNFTYLALGLLLFPLSLAFIAAYALSRDTVDRAIAGISLAVFAFILAFSGTGLTSIAIGLGVFLSPLIVQYSAIDDKKAYKELRPARIASRAAGSALLAISILAAISVFYVTSDDSYSAGAIDALANATVVLALGGEIDGVRAMPGGAELAGQNMKQIEDEIKSMPVFSALKSYYPHLGAVTAFSALQLFAIAVLAPLSGLYAWLLWKIWNKGQEAQHV